MKKAIVIIVAIILAATMLAGCGTAKTKVSPLNNIQFPRNIFSHNVTCSICAGSGQQYIPNLYYDAGMNMWMGGYIACPNCGGSGHIN